MVKKGLQKKPICLCQIKIYWNSGKLFPRPSHLGKERERERERERGRGRNFWPSELTAFGIAVMALPAMRRHDQHRKNKQGLLQGSVNVNLGLS